MKLVKLFVKDGSKFHFGQRKLNSTDIIFHNDSLFSAIMNNYVKLYGSTPQKFPKISSVFYFSNNTLFFPRPFIELDIDMESKDIKKIKFISEGVLEKINEKIEDFFINEEGFLYLDKESTPSIDKFMEPKAFIPRKSGDATPFEMESFEIKNGGFYFFVDDLEDKKIIQAIHMIKNEGLGGERSSGKGLFDKIEISNYEFKEKGNRYFSLSLISPENDDFNKVVAYDIIQRKGFIYSPFTEITYRKKPTYMLVEGSIFQEQVNGSIKKVANAQGDLKHDVYRDGRAVMMRF